MTNPTTFSQRVFFWAGIYGIVVLVPLYFLEDRIGVMFPPAINHPEHYYGFIGVALAWQFAFLVIARDPVRFRPIMIPAMAEKILFPASAFLLCAQGRVAAASLGPAVIDLVLAALFFVSFRQCGAKAKQ